VARLSFSCKDKIANSWEIFFLFKNISNMSVMAKTAQEKAMPATEIRRRGKTRRLIAIDSKWLFALTLPEIYTRIQNINCQHFFKAVN
jgi:hypothetical protein